MTCYMVSHLNMCPLCASSNVLVRHLHRKIYMCTWVASSSLHIQRNSLILLNNFIPFFLSLSLSFLPFRTRKQDGSIEFEEFIRALSITSRGNLDEKLNCAFFTKKFLIIETLKMFVSRCTQNIFHSFITHIMTSNCGMFATKAKKSMHVGKATFGMQMVLIRKRSVFYEYFIPYKKFVLWRYILGVSCCELYFECFQKAHGKILFIFFISNFNALQ